MSAKREKWQLERPNDWQKQLDKLPFHVAKKVFGIILELENLQDPRIFSVYEKNLRYGSAFILRFDKSYRLAYRVDFDKHIITLLRVGDHKTVGSKE